MAFIQRHVHDLAHKGGISREMYQCVVGHSSGDQRAVVFVDLLHQHIRDLSLISADLFSGGLLHRLEYPVELLLHLRFRHLLHGCRRGSGPFGIDKGKRIVILHAADHVDSLIHIFLRLSREAHDNIRGNSHIRDLPTDLFRQFQILFLGITAVHGL